MRLTLEIRKREKAYYSQAKNCIFACDIPSDVHVGTVVHILKTMRLVENIQDWHKRDFRGQRYEDVEAD